MGPFFGVDQGEKEKTRFRQKGSSRARGKGGEDDLSVHGWAGSEKKDVSCQVGEEAPIRVATTGEKKTPRYLGERGKSRIAAGEEAGPGRAQGKSMEENPSEGKSFPFIAQEKYSFLS